MKLVYKAFNNLVLKCMDSILLQCVGNPNGPRPRGKHHVRVSHFNTSRDWEGCAPCKYGAKIFKMSHYKTAYQAQHAP